jgi:hypothetical protein
LRGRCQIAVAAQEKQKGVPSFARIFSRRQSLSNGSAATLPILTVGLVGEAPPFPEPDLSFKKKHLEPIYCYKPMDQCKGAKQYLLHLLGENPRHIHQYTENRLMKDC